MNPFVEWLTFPASALPQALDWGELTLAILALNSWLWGCVLTGIWLLLFPRE